MTYYTLLRRQMVTDNTSLTGHGDYQIEKWVPVLSAYAETARKAQNKFRKMFGKHVVFSGAFPSYILQES
jgi:hypothetical protein